MNKQTIAALHEGMEAVQSGKVAPGRVWIVKRRPDGTVERRQVDAKAFQREQAKAAADKGSVLPARSKLGVSQDRFAELLGLSAATVRNWEQGRRKPTGALLKLLDIAERHPEIFVGHKKADRKMVEAVTDELLSPEKTKPGKGRILAMRAMSPNLDPTAAAMPMVIRKQKAATTAKVKHS